MRDGGRRSFLSAAGIGLAGFTGGLAAKQDTAMAAVPELPWRYAPLNVETLRKAGHGNYPAKECGAGCFAALIEALREEVGTPYDTIPVDMMRYAAGGVAGFATLCGSLNGACAVVNLVCDEETTKEVITELFSWYASTELPTDLSNLYASEHQYEADDPYTIDAELPQTIAGGNLCHLSVSRWCKKSRFGSGSKERSERCARVTGDVAAKTAELLNAVHRNTFSRELPLPADESGCRSCHEKSTTSFTRGKMDCMLCHEPVTENHGLF